MNGALRSTLEEQTHALRAPLAGDAPAGSDAQFDTNYERARLELEKLSSITGERPDWSLVAGLTDALLRAKTKDLRLAAWGAVAKTSYAGFEGLAEGLMILRSFVVESWDAVHPRKRDRARANLFGWLWEQLFLALEARDVTRDDADSIALGGALVEEIDSTLRSRLGEAYAGPGRMRGLLRAKREAIPPEPPPPPEFEAVATPVAEPPVSESTTNRAFDEALETPDDARLAIERAADLQLRAAALLQKANPADPEAHRARRLAARLRLGARAETSAPPDGSAQRVRARIDSGDLFGALAEAESALDASPACLDLHRAELDAVARLGGAYDALRIAIEQDVRALLATDAYAIDRIFDNGEPAADPATRAWAESLRRLNASPDALLREYDQEIASRFAWAHALLRDGRGAEAIGLALGLARRAPDGRSRFLGMLDIAKAAAEANELALAIPLLQDLLVDVQQRALEVWEPQLCVQLYALLLRGIRQGIRTLGPDESELHARLFRLDPVVATRGAASAK